MLSTVTTKGQVTIPADIRSRFHIVPNDRVDFIVEGDRIVITPIKSMKDLRGIVPLKSATDIDTERSVAKAAVATRVIEEMS
jgi:AbrB family looped-hinge helix DNA binding protein